MKPEASRERDFAPAGGERSAGRRYGVSVLASVAALLVTELFYPWLGHTIYLFVYPAVMVSAWYGGFLAGALTAVAGAFMAAYLFLPPVGTFRVDDPGALGTAAMLVGTAWLVSTLSRNAERARTVAMWRAVQAEELARSLEEQAVELEMQIEENQGLMAELEGTNEQLRKTALEAQASSRAKSAFLATMSHELRTPLNAIDGYAELIEMGIYGPTTPQQKDGIARIRTSHHVLLAMVDLVIDQARIEAGKLPLEVAPVPIAEVVPATCAVAEPLARSKEIQVACEPVPPDVTAAGDAMRVEQILLNLVSNAVKFTPPGGKVTISCEPVDHRVEIRVSDTGPGIRADQLEAIFDPFFQLDQSTTRAEGGAGLGLTISRDLAKAMGGRISVSSRLGEGSTFTLTLPRHPPPAPNGG